ncbi:D-lactate dehydrogenase [Wilcoxina mikolae CBS 423.85]|nr:D-lactate dehydrogenase [Wilcoxina mikolae CBS 423.85]
MSARLLLRVARPTPSALRIPPVLRRLQSTDGKDAASASKKSFRGQLYDSTARRVQAERAKVEQRLHVGNETGARQTGASSATLGGVVGTVFIALAFYYLGSQSAPHMPITSTTPLSTLSPPSHNTSKANLEAAWTDFVTLLGEEHVATTPEELTRHSSSDWSSFHNTSYQPFLVLYPSSTAEVSAIAKICHERRIPMTAFSGGTSLEGHFAATRGGVCIDFSRMDKVLALHKGDLDVVVQPAVGWEQLNEDLAKDGLFFPPDPGPGAMIGGMVGTGCSGTNAARYGTMREWVLSLTVVLADGTIIKTRQRPRKSSAGYDLTRLFIGSEGTLGLVTEATLKLAVKPQCENVAVSSFPSIKHAAEVVAQVIASGVPLAAIELLDDVQMHCINESGTTSRAWKVAPTLFFKFSGTPAGVKEQISQVRAVATKNSASSFEFASSDAERHELWSARKEALWSVMALKRNDEDKVWTTDVAVPISVLPVIIEETKADITASGLLGAIVGHVGDGNFHAIIMFGKEEQRVAEGVVERMVKRAVEMEGTVTGEHGVGLVKRDYLPMELGKETVDAMRRIKTALDPLCLLNCDKG